MSTATPFTHLKKRDLEERLRGDGVAIDLPNNYTWTEDLSEIKKGIQLIEKFERKSRLRVGILGQIWQSVATFETQYRVYELNTARGLQGTEYFGEVISREYLEERKAWLLSPAYKQETALVA